MKVVTHHFDALASAQAFGFGVNGPVLEMGDVQPELNILKGDTFELIAIDALYPGQLVRELPDAVIVANHTHFMPSLDPNKPSLGKFDERYLRSLLFARETADYVETGSDFDVTAYRSTIASICYRRWDQIGLPFSYFFSNSGAMYPDLETPINHDILFFVFEGSTGKAEFVFVYHANHPTNSADRGKSFGSDFWDVIRMELRRELGDIPVFCLPGNLADVRSNMSKKRIDKLPSFKWNRKFSNYQDEISLDGYYREYQDAVAGKEVLFKFKLNESDMSVESHPFEVSGEILCAQVLKLGEFEFRIIPYEVSSVFDERLSYGVSARKFNVSCSGETKGYLPHPSQLIYGGYEVKGSLSYMNLVHKQVISNRGQNFLELKVHE